MKFFKKRKKISENNLKIEDINVATSIVVSNFSDGSGRGPMYVKCYLLVFEKDEQYYDVFSNKLIKKEENAYYKGIYSKAFNIPYIEKVEPLTKFVRNENQKDVNLQMLFDFMIYMNVSEQVGAFDDVNCE